MTGHQGATSQRAKRRQQRARYSQHVGVLDLFRPRVGEVATLSDVYRLLWIDPESAVLRNLLSRHSDELRASGWDSDANTFTRQAIIRVALLLRPSTSARAARIAEAARQQSQLISFDHAPKSTECETILSEALMFATRVRDEDPGEVWASLQKVDRHTLQGMLMTLAATTPIESAGVLRWLRDLGRGGVADGLARLVPTRVSSTGVPMSVIDQIAIDDELDELERAAADEDAVA